MAPKEHRTKPVDTKSTETEIRIVVANPRLSSVRARVAAASARLPAASEDDALNWIESVSVLDAKDASDEAR